MIVRLARQGDHVQLAQFRCGGELPCEDEIEAWVRDEAWDWFVEGAPQDDRRLLLFFTEDIFGSEAALVAVAAHEQDDGPDIRFINAVAVLGTRQGEGFGRVALATVLDDARHLCPVGVATWLVHPANFRSVAMCESAGAEYVSPPEDKPYLRFVLDL